MIFFLTLAVGSVLILIRSYMYVRSSIVWFGWLAIAGLAYLFELFIFVVGHSYAYNPGVLPEPFYDSTLGAISSQGFAVPIAAVATGVFQLNWKWMVGIIAFFFGIEVLFLRLDLYEHRWWETWMTSISLFVAFPFCKWWMRKLCSSPSVWLQFISIYLFQVSIHTTSMFFLMAVFHLFTFCPGWFSDPSRDAVALMASYSAVVLLAYTYLIYKRLVTFTILIVQAVGWVLIEFVLIWGDVLTYASPLVAIGSFILHVSFLFVMWTLFRDGLQGWNFYLGNKKEAPD
ncbi:hypothetical protein [Bacillus fonticola]|uniref:hypothetical protein n=1 Tax=Bacillus fonticola TaxID=2728853 RepID=UPI001474968F|nr:hypothetical protein [Bacillus fonticola]